MNIAEFTQSITSENIDILIRLSIVADAALLIFAALCLDKSLKFYQPADSATQNYPSKSSKSREKSSRNCLLNSSRNFLTKGVCSLTLAVCFISLICYYAAGYSRQSAALAFAAFAVVAITMRGGLSIITVLCGFDVAKNQAAGGFVTERAASAEQKKVINRAVPLFAGCAILSIYLLFQITFSGS